MVMLVLWWSALVWLVPFLLDATGTSVPWWPGPVTWVLVGAAIYVLSGIHIVNQWDRLPVMRLGRYAYTAGAGVQWIEPLLKRALERAMAMKARAEKEAQAELRRAQMQVEIAGHLKDAAHVMDDSAWRLKGLETLMELTRSAQNNTVLVPTELLGSLTALGITA